MRSVLSIVFICGAVCLALANKPLKLKDGQLDAVLSNDRVLSNYIKCLMDLGACTREGAELKSKLFCVTQMLIDICTFVVTSFPIKKFRHFFVFKRYTLFWMYDTVVEIVQLMIIIRLVARTWMRRRPSFIECVRSYAKFGLFFSFCVFQNFCRTPFRRIAPSAARPRSATPKKWSRICARVGRKIGKPSPTSTIHRGYSSNVSRPAYFECFATQFRMKNIIE